MDPNLCTDCGETLIPGRLHTAAECRDHCKAQIRELQSERDALREAALNTSNLHRRAQRLEGVEARMASLRLSHARELGQILNRAHFTEHLWHRRYVEAVDQIRSAGVDDKLQGQDNYRTGNLDEMIRRLVVERDAFRKALNTAQAKILNLERAARRVVDHVHDVGSIQNHGHNPWPEKKPTACAECQKLNELAHVLAESSGG